MLMKRQILLMLLLALLALPLSADSPNPFTGTYQWHSDDEDGVAQSVRATVAQEGGATKVAISVTWTPGAAVEIQTMAPPDNIRTVTVNSHECTEIGFAFSDSFKNPGVGKLTICGDTADLTLDETATVEPRAVRQYGDYTLMRRQ